MDDWLWCLHCGRCYQKSECRVVPSRWSDADIEEFRRLNIDEVTLAVMREPSEMCAYPDCDGALDGDGIEWERIREAHPEYPAVPDRCPCLCCVVLMGFLRSVRCISEAFSTWRGSRRRR